MIGSIDSEPGRNFSQTPREQTGNYWCHPTESASSLLSSWCSKGRCCFPPGTSLASMARKPGLADWRPKGGRPNGDRVTAEQRSQRFEKSELPEIPGKYDSGDQ